MKKTIVNFMADNFGSKPAVIILSLITCVIWVCLIGRVVLSAGG